MKKFTVTILSILILFFCAGCTGKSEKPLFGVWWWSKDLPATYLEFASENDVTEIYYCDSAFDESTKNFIKSANGKNIKVYLLAGEYQWLDDSKSLYRLIERYKKFQSETDGGFAGIHLDIEPHQNPLFSQNRVNLLTALIKLANDLHDQFTDIKFDYDIPFWIDDEINFSGKTQPAYAHMIEAADRTFIMSYRDSAEKIYSVAEDEIEFAKSVNKTLVLGVETFSREGDQVSFMEEGKEYMYGEIEKLKARLPDNCGISVHQIKTWYDLKD